MPELNRDKERLYRPGRLSVWFLVSSGLLLASLVWMVVADYARPWKRVQKDYYAKRTEVLRAREEARRRQVLEDTELMALAGRLREARRAFEADPKVAGLREEIVAARRRKEQVEARFKEVSGTWAERKYELEETRLDHAAGRASAEDVEEVQAEYGELVAERDRLAREVAARAADEAKRTRELADLEKPKKELEAEWARRTARLTAEEMRIAEAQQKGESAWRNALGIDFLVPTIQPRKVVNPHVHDNFNFATSAKVDMCMSCHMGIDDPVMAVDATGKAVIEAESKPQDARSKAEEAKPKAAVEIPAVYRAHPHLDLILGPTSAHKMDKVGCTVCHAGRGWSLDFERAAHTPQDEEERKRWEKEYGWAPPRWVEYPMLPLHHVEGQCWKCHVEGIVYPTAVAHPASPDDDRPARLFAEPEAIFRTHRVATQTATGTTSYLPVALTTVRSSTRPATPIPLVGQSVVPGVRRDSDGDGDVDGDDSPELFVPHLARAPKGVDDPTKLPGALWRPTRLERGQEIAREYGCYGCHLIEGFPKLAGFPRGAGEPGADLATPAPGTLINGLPKVGWDLTSAGDKLQPAFVRGWLRDPTSYRSDTRMPAFYWHTPQDKTWNPVRTADGKPAQRHVHDESEDVRIESEVEIEAIATFLAFASKPRETAYPEPPEGDPKRGSETFFSVGCYGCHVGPDRWQAESWVKDDGARFRGEPAQGPRLTALASKLKGRGWLYAWLAEPRHYWSTTRMPNMRWRDELAADGKTVVRTADQARADVVAYLMRGRDEAFEAQAAALPKVAAWTDRHRAHLDAMWTEFYGKGQDPKDVESRLRDLVPEPTGKGYVRVTDKMTAAERDDRLEAMGKLAAVGEKVISYRGCFGCHNIAGTEGATQIGKDLKAEGLQDIHKFDFGLLHDMERTRWAWIERKIQEPRAFDRGRVKLWTERLKMPKFNLQPEGRTAVTSFVLGMVLDEPIRPEARFRPDDAEREILAGRAVIARYGCDSCHTIEGKTGLLTREQEGQETWRLPPNLYGEGNRRRPEQLFRFLKAPWDLRPGVIQRMPMFRLSDEEASALVGYFSRLAGRDRTSYDPLDMPLDTKPYAEPKTIEVTKGTEKQTLTVRSDVEQAKALFDVFNCASCHLPRGTPGADPTQGGQAPPFTVVGPMLQREWVVAFLRNPQTQSEGTKMPQFWEMKGRSRKAGDTLSVSHPGFRFDAGPDATNDEVAEAQMKALARYLIYHYDPTITPPAEPAAPGR